MLRIGNRGTHQRARKNVTIGATHNAPSHHTNKKETKRSRNTKLRTAKTKNDIDSSCTNNESEEGKRDTSHNDQDSDVSFEIDNDEEIDAAEIEEEEWVEFIQKSTMKLWKRWKMRI